MINDLMKRFVNIDEVYRAYVAVLSEIETELYLVQRASCFGAGKGVTKEEG
jgi:hypothetical protein